MIRRSVCSLLVAGAALAFFSGRASAQSSAQSSADRARATGLADPDPAPAIPIGNTVDTALSLGDAVRLAASASTAARVGRARTAQAAARVVESRSALLPSLALVATQRQRTFNTAELGMTFPAAPGQPPLFDPGGEVLGPVNVYDVRGRLSQALLDPAAFRRLRAAQAAERASGAEATSEGERAAVVAAGAYLRAIRADAQVAARLADSSLAAELLSIAREQLAAGTGIALDVTRAAAQLAASRATLIAARGDRDRTLLELARAVGLDATAHVRPSDSLGMLPAAQGARDEAALVATALVRRADLRALDAQIETARSRVGAVRAERLPTIRAFLDDGAIGKSVDHLRNTYAWGIQASLPVFEGFQRQGHVQEQEALTAELELRRRDLVTQVTIEVRSALVDLRTAAQQADATRERLELAEQEVGQARERFAAGVSGNADVITASLSLNAARTARVDALAAQQAARIALASALGSITELP